MSCSYLNSIAWYQYRHAARSQSLYPSARLGFELTERPRPPPPSAASSRSRCGDWPIWPALPMLNCRRTFNYIPVAFTPLSVARWDGDTVGWGRVRARAHACRTAHTAHCHTARCTRLSSLPVRIYGSFIQAEQMVTKMDSQIHLHGYLRTSWQDLEITGRYNSLLALLPVRAWILTLFSYWTIGTIYNGRFRIQYYLVMHAEKVSFS